VGFQIAAMFVSRLFLMLVVERCMRVFFDRRRSGFPAMAISYLAYPVVLTAIAAFMLRLDPPPPMALAAILDAAPRGALMYAITLNYEGAWKKRFAAAVSIPAVGLAANYALAISLGACITAYPNFAARQGDAHFLFETIASLLLFLAMALLLQNLKSARKNEPVLPAVWVSILAIPLSSIAAAFIIARASGIPAAAQVLAICVLLGINALAFHLRDRLSAAHAREMRSSLRAREKECRLAQCKLAEESLEQARRARHDMVAHFAALRDIRPLAKLHKFHKRSAVLPARGLQNGVFSGSSCKIEISQELYCRQKQGRRARRVPGQAGRRRQRNQHARRRRKRQAGRPPARAFGAGRGDGNQPKEGRVAWITISRYCS